MSKKHTSGSTSKLTIVGIAILAMVAIALSIFAVTQNNTASETNPDYTFTPDLETDTGGEDNDDASGENSEEEPKPEPQPEPEPAIELQPHTRFIATGTDNQVIRGEFGSCEGEPGWAEVSQDGSISWELSNTLVQEAMQIMGVSIGTAGYVEMTTLDTVCEPFMLRSYIGGYSWQYAPGEVESRWYFNPHQADALNTPLGQVEAPCEVIQLSVSESATRAAVLCKDSTVMSSTDDGQSWSSAGETTGAVAVAAQDDRLLIANGNAEGCNGIQLQTLQSGEAISVGSCLEVSADERQLAFHAFSNDVALWSGDSLRWSIDGGATWL